MPGDSDHQKRERRGALWSAGFLLVLIGFMLGSFVWSMIAQGENSTPLLMLLLLYVVLGGAMFVGIGLALKERLKEVKRGESEEAKKY